MSLVQKNRLFFFANCRSIKSILLVASKCLYNAASLSCFSSCVRRKVDVTSAASGTVNDASSILLVFGVL